MKILFSAIRYDYNDKSRGYSFEYENFYKSLKYMDGINVIYFDTCDFWNIQERKRINEKLIETVEQEKPDILFNFHYRDQISKETFFYLKNNTETVVVNWFADDHWRFEGSASPSKEWCWCFDYCVTTDVESLKKYSNIGYTNILLSQWGCNHHDYVKKETSYEYDVSFVGQPHGDRRNIINYLSMRGIQVACFGYGWDENNPNSTRVSQTEMVEIFNKSKINLNLSNSSVADASQQIKRRNFEVPGCGAFLLTSNVINLNLYYDVGKEVVCYQSLEDMADKISYYLKNEKERENIKDAGYRKTLEKHTYEKRFMEIFNTVLKKRKIFKRDLINIELLLNERVRVETTIKDEPSSVVIFHQNQKENCGLSITEYKNKNKYIFVNLNDKSWDQIQKIIKNSRICFFVGISDCLIKLSNSSEALKDKVCCIIPENVKDEKIHKINWSVTDVVLCKNEATKKFLYEKLSVSERKLVHFCEGIDTRKIHYKKQASGYNIAFYGKINFHTGAMLLLQFAKKIVERNKKYKLFLSGSFQDARDVLYYQQMIRELDLNGNIIIETEDIDFDSWLENKNYLLCTSQNQISNKHILLAMYKGIKPIIHNFINAKEVFPEKYIWSDINEGIKMVESNEYDSEEYRKFVEDHFSIREEENKFARLVDVLMNINEYRHSLPLVTVGVTNYNYGNFIGQCIDSILMQKYPNLEILVVDDCSKDNSVNIIKKFEQTSNNIRGIYNEVNSGCGVLTIQQVIKEAKGEFITIIDADDYYPSDDVIEQYIREFESNPEVDYIYANRQVVDSAGNKGQIWVYQDWEDKEIINQIFRRFGSGVIPMYGMFRTEYYRKNNRNWTYMPDVKVAYDTLHCVMSIKYGLKRKFLNKVLLSYRQHGNNITQNVSSRIKAQIVLLEYIIENFTEEVYLPQYEWNKGIGKETEALKFFLIGNYYFEFYNLYYSGAWKPWKFETDIPMNEMVENLTVVEKLIYAYFQKCKKITRKYDSKMEGILEELIKLKSIAHTKNEKLIEIDHNAIHLAFKETVRRWFADEGDKTLRLDYGLDEKSVVFDIGGFEGQWASDIFSKYCSYIYVFEPVKSFFDKIKNRFEKNNKIQCYQMALSDKNEQSTIMIKSDASSLFGNEGIPQEINSRRAVDFIIENKIEHIDLIKINIEGGEYELLEDFINSGMIERLGNIQVQFHDVNGVDSLKRMHFIQKKLSETHYLTYQYYPYVWENWKKR